MRGWFRGDGWLVAWYDGDERERERKVCLRQRVRVAHGQTRKQTGLVRGARLATAEGCQLLCCWQHPTTFKGLFLEFLEHLQGVDRILWVIKL